MVSLFADPTMLATLAAQLEALTGEHPPAGGLRAWIAGCAMGEDAYACAMLLCDAASQAKSAWPVKVFATDSDPQLLAVAWAGVYPAAQLAQLAPDQLRRYWLLTQGHYRVKQILRENIVFASHQLLHDPPFAHLHLIVCRGLFAALGPEQQVQAVEQFAFGLRPGGLLLLGGEPAATSRHFENVDRQCRLYLRRSKLPVLRPDPAAGAPDLPHDPPPRAGPPVASARQPALIVGAHSQIVHISGGAERFLRIGSGAPSYYLLDIILPQLRKAVSTTLARAVVRERAAESRPVAVMLDGAEELVTVVVQPLPGDDQYGGNLMVLFDVGDLPQTAAADAAQSADLAALRDEHTLILAQYDAAIQELRTANEELQIINEEHVVANEELEVRREELNTVNEELVRVNAELSGKIDEVSRINADLQNLMAASDIGTLFLDRQLRVMRYTPQVEELFNLLPADLGRPLAHLTHRLQDTRLLDDARQLLADLTPVEREVQHTDGRWFLLRLRPYRAADHRIDGVVLTFLDISERRKMTEALRASEETLRRSHSELERRVQKRTAELLEAQARLQRLLGALVRSQEGERQRIARELHDTLGQFLTGLTLRLSVLQKQAESLPELDAGLADLRRVAGQIDSELDRLTMELRPPALDDLGLEDALQEYTREWAAASGVPVDVLTCGLGGVRLPAAVETTVYRIVQEALTNVLKHARASRVSVILERRGDRLRAIVEDDGQGFDPEALEGQGKGGRQLGLLGMAERAALAGGELSVESAPGSGTTIYIHIPLAHTADGAP